MDLSSRRRRKSGEAALVDVGGGDSLNIGALDGEAEVFGAARAAADDAEADAVIGPEDAAGGGLAGGGDTGGKDTA